MKNWMWIVVGCAAGCSSSAMDLNSAEVGVEDETSVEEADSGVVRVDARGVDDARQVDVGIDAGTSSDARGVDAGVSIDAREPVPTKVYPRLTWDSKVKAYVDTFWKVTCAFAVADDGVRRCLPLRDVSAELMQSSCTDTGGFYANKPFEGFVRWGRRVHAARPEARAPERGCYAVYAGPPVVCTPVVGRCPGVGYDGVMRIVEIPIGPANWIAE